MPSFDVVSSPDIQEIDNAINEDSGTWFFNKAQVEVVVRGTYTRNNLTEGRYLVL